MKICILMKQVASEDSTLIINDNKSDVELNGLNLVTNEPDNYALEEGLSIKEKTSGEVVICTLGPDSCQQVIKDSLAKGADRAIHITTNNASQLSPLNISKIIAENIREENFDIILSGLQSNDYGYAQIGIILSELLNYSHASLVIGTKIINDKTLKVKRELENGWFQWSEIDLPASLSIQSGINNPRYATLKGIMSVKNKPIKKLENKSENFNNGYTLKDLYIPKKSKDVQVIEGNTDDVVNEIIDVLKNKIKVI